VHEVVEEAKVYSQHASKDLDVEDVKLSIQAKMNTGFTYAAPREVGNFLFI
jgi:hypothetical protein